MQNVINTTSEIIERIKKDRGHQKDAEVARDLKAPPKKLGVWKLRNTVPLEELTTFCRQFGYNLEWVLTGEGQKRRAQPCIVMEAPEGYRHHPIPLDMDRRQSVLFRKLQRILDEGDKVKIEAVKAQLAAFDPGEKKQGMDCPENERAGTKNNHAA
ncbi:helix-turn-helix domain-containing protein [Geobacter sp. SVR]|uniref:helix-turn-helix domain-containing protein n=1 Tax=Geobacter sp. SVR TaxID=2495594 RepID=UPI00143EF87D|nr:helix-turn-helix domain-containing protein [Geobacter sp. SVR]BCS54517.1 hypothetical protein GSVR_28250 [Geobacter sp. SVR]GCF87117.1 hypothetical protein GSbR_37170 [Geobacter sp. SVR]